MTDKLQNYSLGGEACKDNRPGFLDTAKLGAIEQRWMA